MSSETDQTRPQLPVYVDRDATEPRLVSWAQESEPALHHGGAVRTLQLNPASMDTLVDDYGVGLTKRITSSHEFDGSDKVHDAGVEVVRRRWPKRSVPPYAKSSRAITRTSSSPRSA